jgi:DNA helicase-2/ATP-dependent DNA helicase PcrA
MLDRLKDWRLHEAKRRGVPAYVVFTDATLQAITEQQPAHAEDLLAISGIGPDKHSRYAECVLALVRGEDPPEPQEP